MKKFFLIVGLLIFNIISAQFDNIAAGETLTYRIHYGFLTAGYATLSTTKTSYNGQPVFYVKGVGRTTGAVRTFFRVDDTYESYINEHKKPLFYVRNVYEGGYTQHLQSIFHHDNNSLTLVDIKTPANPHRNIKVPSDVQDMLSVFYYLRSLPEESLKVGSVHKLNVWIDDELFPFQIRVVGTEMIETKFGKINCLKIIPLVMSGRVFKEKEGVTMWVSNDHNRVPILIKASLRVGSLKASIDSYSNVKTPLKFSK